MFGRSGGAGVTNHKGEILAIRQIDAKLHGHLVQLFKEGEKFPLEINSSEDVFERLSAFRSLRRASKTLDLNNNILAADVDVVNRWKTVEAAKCRKPNWPMKHYCAEISELFFFKDKLSLYD